MEKGNGLAYLYCRWGTKVVGQSRRRTEEERKRKAIEPRLKVANATTSPATTLLPPSPPFPSLLLLLSKREGGPTSLPLPNETRKGREGGRTMPRKPSLWIRRCQGRLSLLRYDETNDPDKSKKTGAGGPPGYPGR